MFKRTLLSLTLLAICPVIFSFIQFGTDQKVIKTIVIDAGHGGHDGGARGTYSSEKDICLDISLKLGAQIEKEIPDVKIIYTRTSDSYPELHARAKMANQVNADLFISIHVNSAPAKKGKNLAGYTYVGKGSKRRKVPKYTYYTIPNPAKGTETYIWGAHKNEDKEVALRENAPMMMEANYKDKYGEVDPNSPEFIALSLLKTKQFFKRSATLASLVEEEFTKVGRTSRDVKQRQAGIWVLQATAMPSVLVETGFISNKEDEDYLNSAKGQAEIAHCVTNAVKSYISWIEEHQNANSTTTAKVNVPNEKSSYEFLEQVDKMEKERQGR
ncbi:MAG: N-acetylmuramoyl-L-alanine amidase [Chitinophagaceae bacterium]|jgi:N-acetylmuramoyl-L-alanine amidase|nr:N-acetylmuramoyl-L-alanine amidase [Chitinophagaceae bacterium]